MTFEMSKVFVLVIRLMPKIASNYPEHVVTNAALHCIRFAVFVFDSRGSSFSRHLFQPFTKLGVGLGYGFGLGWESVALVILVRVVL